MLVSISDETPWDLTKRVTSKKNPDLNSYFKNIDVSVEEFAKLLETSMLYTHHHDCGLLAKPTSLHLQKDTNFSASFIKLGFTGKNVAESALKNEILKKYASIITHRPYQENLAEKYHYGLSLFFELEEPIKDIATYAKAIFSLHEAFNFADNYFSPSRIYSISGNKSEIIGEKLPMEVIYELIDEHYMFYFENMKYYFPSAVTEYEKRVHSFRVKEGVGGFCNE